MHQILNTNTCNRSKQKKHDAAQNSLRNTLKQCTKFAYNRKADGCGCCNPDNNRTGDFCDRHCTSPSE